ncbi:MFS transporter [Povalibacter sp.]|uniref:MFS transporter n=1 Tax=Povalibacter sp. TaxID=1962978 RepID=UPI002F3FA48E
MRAQDDQRMFYGWVNAAIFFFVYLASMGLVVYGYSVIFPAMVADFNWSRGSASIANSIHLLVLGFLAPVVAIVLKKLGSKTTIILGLIVLLAGMTLLGTVTTGIVPWTIIWGFIVPIGLAFAGLVPIQLNVMQWFSVKRATVLGLVMTAAPVGGFIAQPVYTWFMEHAGTWRVGWLVSAALAAVALILSFWVRNKPEDVGQYPDGIRPEEAKKAGGPQVRVARTYRTSTPWTPGEAFRTRTLRFFLLTFVTKAMALMLILSHGVLHLTDVGLTDMQAAYVLMSVLIGSAVIRFPMGWVGDRIEPRWVISVSMGLMLLSFLVIWQAPAFVILMVCGPIFGAAFGASLVMDTTMLGNYFSPESYPSIMGIVLPVVTLCMAAVPTVSGYIADQQGSYELAFVFCAIGLVISFISSFLLSPPHKSIAPAV